MNKGIKAVFCMTLTFALMAGIITACTDKATNNNSGSINGSSEDSIVVPVVSETTVPSDTDASYESDSLDPAVPEKGTAGDYEYRILEKDEYSPRQAKRGYYIDMLNQDGSPYYIVICSGEKNTGGYDIEIVGVDYQDGTLLITVKETSPAPGDMVTQAIEYPYCVLELDKLPGALHIVNTDGEAFSDINAANNEA